MMAINWIVLYPNFLIRGRTLAVNSVNRPTRPSGVAIPTMNDDRQSRNKNDGD